MDTLLPEQIYKFEISALHNTCTTKNQQQRSTYVHSQNNFQTLQIRFFEIRPRHTDSVFKFIIKFQN